MILTPIRREVLLIGLMIAFLFAAPMTTPRYETVYEGILAVDGSLFFGKPYYINKILYYSPYSKVPLKTLKVPLPILPLTGRILIQCTDEIPKEVLSDQEAFSSWVKAHCQFSPLW